MGGTEATLDALSRAAQATPEDPRGWLRLSLALLEAGDRERAFQGLKRATGLAANDPALLLPISRAFEAAHALPEALQLARHVAQLAPELVAAHDTVGHILIQMGDPQAAALTLRVALARTPDAPELHVRLGLALQLTHHLKDALRHARRAAELPNAPPDAHRLLASLYEELDQPDEYIEALRAVTRLDGSDFRAAIALGRKLAQEGRRQEALEILTPLTQPAPPTADDQLSLGTALAEARAIAPAIRCLREALRNNPDLAQAHLQLGLVLRTAGALHDALSSLRAATSLKPNDPEILYQLGLTLRDASELREAAGVLVRASAADPSSERIQEALADVLAALRAPKSVVPSSEMSQEHSAGAFTGDLSIFSLPELLEFLLNQHASGVLMVHSPSGDGSLELFQGMLVGATYPGSRSLAQVLLDIDLITQTDLKRSVVRQEDLEHDAVVAAVLVNNNLVDRTSLHDLVAQQIQHAMIEMLGWREGQAAFRRQQRTVEKPEILIDTRWALLEALRAMDELGKRKR